MCSPIHVKPFVIRSLGSPLFVDELAKKLKGDVGWYMHDQSGDGL